VWLRDPAPAWTPTTADIAIQTDCLSHAVEFSTGCPYPHGFECAAATSLATSYNNALQHGYAGAGLTPRQSIFKLLILSNQCTFSTYSPKNFRQSSVSRDWPAGSAAVRWFLPGCRCPCPVRSVSIRPHMWHTMHLLTTTCGVQHINIEDVLQKPSWPVADAYGCCNSIRLSSL
jgi:hypothetical protein